MLLAADYKDENGKDCVEPLEAPWAKAGTPVVLEGTDAATLGKPAEISADDFFKVVVNVADKSIVIGGKKLCADGKALATVHTVSGEVH